MYKEFEDIVDYLNPNIEWKRRNLDDISKKGNVPVYRKKSDLFLGRYILNENHIKQIELFRNNSQSNDIELNQIQDVELDNLNVRIILTHDFKKHINKTIELLSLDENDDPFLRSSTTSTNEHIMVFQDQ
jgi:hypothetical protein